MAGYENSLVLRRVGRRGSESRGEDEAGGEIYMDEHGEGDEAQDDCYGTGLKSAIMEYGFSGAVSKWTLRRMVLNRGRREELRGP